MPHEGPFIPLRARSPSAQLPLLLPQLPGPNLALCERSIDAHLPGFPPGVGQPIASIPAPSRCLSTGAELAMAHSVSLARGCGMAFLMETPTRAAWDVLLLYSAQPSVGLRD